MINEAYGGLRFPTDSLFQHVLRYMKVLEDSLANKAVGVGNRKPLYSAAIDYFHHFFKELQSIFLLHLYSYTIQYSKSSYQRLFISRI